MCESAARLIVLTSTLALVACDPTPQVTELIRENDPLESAIGFLPRNEETDNAGRLAALGEQAGRTLTDAERRLYSRDAGGAWREWSDEKIRFEIPDDPLIQVTRVTPSEARLLQVVGSFIGTSDNRFETSYRITVGDDLPYGLILISENEWFDEGICMCGAILWKSYYWVDGNLLEFSLLEDGSIKKVQVINDGQRAILFEWTHSALTRGAYSRIAASIRLRELSKRSGADWLALTKERRKEEPPLGWLRLGMRTDEVAFLLGDPLRGDRDEMVYRREERYPDGSGGFIQRTFPISGGRLDRFREGWFEFGDLPPLKGSAAWALEIAEKSDENGAVSSAEISAVFAEFVRTAPTEDKNWNDWCRAIYKLADAEHRSEKVLSIVEARFLDPGLNGHYAMHVLSEYKSTRRDSLVKQRIEYLLGDEATDELRDSELGNLYTYADRLSEERDLIRRGLAHGSPAARKAAAWKIDQLEQPEAKEALRALLRDPDRRVRSWSMSSIEDICDAGDLIWLREIRDEENDRNVRGEFDDEIKKLEGLVK